MFRWRWLRRLLILVLLGAFVGHSALGARTGSAGPSAQAYVEQAITLYNQGQYVKAVDVLKKAIAVNPRYARAYSWLGLCYVKLDRNQDAVAAFKQVIALAPNSDDARVARQWLAKLQQPAPQQPAARPPAGAVQPAVPAGPVYLVDMPAATGVTAANRPEKVQLFGQTYRKAIVEAREYWCDNAEWRVVYNLQRRYARFRALAGVADGTLPEFTVTFIVRADGSTLFESRTMRVGDTPEDLDLNVAGVLQLELIVRHKGRGCWKGAAAWADPIVDPRAPVAQATPAPPSVPQLQSPPIVSPAPPQAPGPVVTPPAVAARTVAVIPFADSSGTHRNAGARVATAVIEEMFKLGRLEMVGQQRILEAMGSTRYDPLDLAFARQTAQRVGAGLVVMGVVERFHVATRVTELIVRAYTKDVITTASFHVVDVATGSRLLSDTARVGLRWTAAQPYGLPSDDDALREATRRMASEVAQRVTFAWARQSGELTVQLAQAVVARNVTRDADFRLQPVGPSTSFSSSALQIVAYCSGTGAKPGQRVQFTWHGPERNEYARETIVLPPEQTPDQPFAVHHAIRPPPGGTFPIGTWRVEIRVEGFLIRTLSFAVTEG